MRRRFLGLFILLGWGILGGSLGVSLGGFDSDFLKCLFMIIEILAEVLSASGCWVGEYLYQYAMLVRKSNIRYVRSGICEDIILRRVYLDVPEVKLSISGTPY